jgi:hypothetical protein
MDEAAMLCDARFEALCTEPCGQELLALNPDNIIPTFVVPLPVLNEASDAGMATALPPAGSDSESCAANVHGEGGCSSMRAGTNEFVSQEEFAAPMTLLIPTQAVHRRLDRQDHPMVSVYLLCS